MNTKHWHSILVCAVLVLLLGIAIRADAPPTPAPPPPPIQPLSPPTSKPKVPDLAPTTAGRRALTAAGTAAIGIQIDIAVSDSRDAQDVAVALCSAGQYMVVFERDAAIYGQRLTSDGSLLGGAFQISGGTNEAINPDVACDWMYNRFIVVWQYNYALGGDPPDYDIRAQGVYGRHNASGSQLYGTWHSVAAMLDGEYSPAIACNSDDHTCLVVFQYGGAGNGDIYGRRIVGGTTDIAVPEARFVIGGSANQDLNADVAWGGQEEKFLVVWQYDDGDSYRL